MQGLPSAISTISNRSSLDTSHRPRTAALFTFYFQVKDPVCPLLHRDCIGMLIGAKDTQARQQEKNKAAPIDNLVHGHSFV